MAQRAYAAIAGLALVLTLWLPWYRIQVPQFGVPGGGSIQFGPVTVTAWHALSTVPIVLLAVAIIGGAAPLLNITRRIPEPLELTKVAGALAIVLVGYRLVVPPWQDSGVRPAWGGYLALIAAFGMLAAATGVMSRLLGRLKAR